MAELPLINKLKNIVGVSWIFVFLPIILTSFVVAYVLVYLELDEKNGNKKNQESDYLSVSKYYDTYLVI